MSGGILLAGNESPLLDTLCAEADKRPERYSVAIIPHAASGEEKANPAADKKIILDWNPASPVSAKTLILSACNKMGGVSHAILVSAAPEYKKKASAFSTQEIDSFIDYNIKGWFFLVRELTALFSGAGAGVLSFVLPEITAAAGDEIPDLAGPIAGSAFRSFAQGVLLSSLNTPYSALGFSASEQDWGAFAAYIFKSMEEGKRNSGRWHKFGKFGIFNR